MNERLKELEILCRIAEYNEFGDVVEVGFDKEKFAELIVRECIGMVLPYNEDDPSAEKLYELADAIGEHFGVEE